MRAGFVLFVLSLLAGCNQASDTTSSHSMPVADTVFINGKILTVDESFSVAEALAISGARIIAVGDNEAVQAYAGDTTKTVDLGGKTVIPGLIDNHMHFIRAVQ